MASPVAVATPPAEFENAALDDERPRQPAVTVACLADGAYHEWQGEAAIERLAGAVAGGNARVWVDLCGATPELVGRVAAILHLHPLLAEDMCERDQRAKLELVENVYHLVLFSLGWDDGQIYDREIDLVLGERFLLSSHSRWWDPRTTRHLRLGVRELLERGPDRVLWAIADVVIDGYFPILDRLGDEIDELEDQVVSRADRATLERLFRLKRELISVRRVTAPEREMFNQLSSREGRLVSREEALYFRDAYDHLIRLTDELDTYRELVSAAVEAYLSTVNNNLSLIMKRLTGFTVVLAGIGAVGGIFGMSEAPNAVMGAEGAGFWVVVAGIVIFAVVAIAILRRIDWI